MTLIALLVITAVLVLLLVWIGLYRQQSRRRAIAVRVWAQWGTIKCITDLSRRVLEAENILDRALRDIGYQGTFGEKLKRMQKTLPNIDAVWQAHKLRNRIAHEPGIRISEQEAESALVAFEKTLRMLLPQ